MSVCPVERTEPRWGMQATVVVCGRWCDGVVSDHCGGSDDHDYRGIYPEKSKQNKIKFQIKYLFLSVLQTFRIDFQFHWRLKVCGSILISLQILGNMSLAEFLTYRCLENSRDHRDDGRRCVRHTVLYESPQYHKLLKLHHFLQTRSNLPFYVVVVVVLVMLLCNSASVCLRFNVVSVFFTVSA